MDYWSHWSDQIAERVIQERGEKDSYTLAAGITPSGPVHIGNFRELITVDMVKRAMERQGKKCRFLFFWDDYDVFRKVPANMPQANVLENHLGKPLVMTPDTHGEASSYAEYHEKKMEKAILKVGISPEFVYQAKEYRSSRYADRIARALENRDKIKAILDQYRTHPLQDDWLPISIFCSRCHTNKMEEMNYLPPKRIAYRCSHCKNEETVHLDTTGIVKLLWRIDWPMRWAQEGVDFEPGGKDHSSEGGSRDTAKQVVTAVYGKKPPVYLMYDFVRVKGGKGKISSSQGEVITLDDVLKIYEPEIIRWIFSSYRTNVEFAISFDLDVLKIYEDYDRAERIYFGAETVSEKKQKQVKRAYELAQIGEIPRALPFQPPFRHLGNIVQIHNFDKKACFDHYADYLKSSVDHRKFENRFNCIVEWLKSHAPESFRFSLRKTKIDPKATGIPSEYLNFIHSLKDFLKEERGETETTTFFYSLVEERKLDLATSFKYIYLCLIGKEKGPRLISFLHTIGFDRSIYLLDI